MLTLELAPGDRPPDFAIGREVNLWRDERGHVCARLFSSLSHRWIEWPGLGVFWFEPHSRVIHVRPAPHVRLDVLQDTFTRFLQPAILQALGWQALHASAVAGPDGVLAFCGPAHAGKSTLAYALGQTGGFRQFADDAFVTSLSDGGVRAHFLPFAARLRPTARRHFEASPQAPVDLVMPPPAPVAAFFLLTQDESLDAPPQRIRVPPARAFSELMAHAHCFDVADPSESKRIVDEYLEIVARVPVFSLTYRPGFDRLDDLLHAVADARASALEHVAVGR